jgi:hypothetical protein
MKYIFLHFYIETLVLRLRFSFFPTVVEYEGSMGFKAYVCIGKNSGWHS